MKDLLYSISLRAELRTKILMHRVSWISYDLRNDRSLLRKTIWLNQVSVKSGSHSFTPLFLILDAICNSYRKENDSAYRSIIITGYPRTGKSILARELAKQLNHFVLKADQLRKIYWRIEDDIKRRKLREELYFKVSKNYPHFLIIEGDDFISENRHIRSEVEPVNLDLLRILNDQTTLATAVIGNSRCSIDEKIKSLNYSREKGTCWSLEDPKFKSDRGMKRLAVISIEGSKNLAEMSDGYGIPYFEINPTRFRDDINNTVSDIITALQEEK